MNSSAAAAHPTPATASSVKRVLVVDDHPIFRHGLSQCLGTLDDVMVCAEAANAQQALHAMRQQRPHVVLVDVSMPGTNGIELVKQMLAEQPRLLILMLSMHDESVYALRAMRAGARGYVMKQQAMETILDALRKVMAGGIYVSPEFSEKLIFKSISGSTGDVATPVDKLSDRELEVLQLIGRHKSTRDISEQLHLSVKTIETHRAHIKEKLNIRDVEQLVSFAVEWVTATEG